MKIGKNSFPGKTDFLMGFSFKIFHACYISNRIYFFSG